MTARGIGVAGFAVVSVVSVAAATFFLYSSPDPPTHDIGPRLAEELASLDTEAWVTILDPERATPGYTLDLYRRRLPFLFDLEGRVVHSWPEVRAEGRARLERNGHLLVIKTNKDIEEYDWEGRRVFRYSLPKGHSPHHDLIRLRNGNLLILAHAREKSVRFRSGVMQDYLLEVDRDGRSVWRWNLRDHSGRFESWGVDWPKQPGHVNSVFELPPNRHHEAGDPRFRPGNLLVSARNLSTIFIIDKVSGEVVWQLSEGLDHQHEARMLPSDHPHAGQILLFNNGLADRESYRRSRVQLIDPRSLETVWEYGSPYFYSSAGGVAQPFSNGNFLIASSLGGRIFEVTPEHDTVWQFEPTKYIPMRPARYAPDHCPQLASLGRNKPVLARTRATPYVDKDLYDFEIPLGPRRSYPDWNRRALATRQACRRLVIPPDAELKLDYRLHREALLDRPFAARFVVDVRDPASGEMLRVFDDEVRSDQEELARVQSVSLAAYAMATTEICLDAQPVGDPNGVDPDKAIVWFPPKIRSRSNGSDDVELELTHAERDLQEQQLRDIGYIE